MALPWLPAATASKEASNTPLLIAFPPLCPASPQQDGEENCRSKREEKNAVQDKGVLMNKVTKLK